MSDKEVYVYEEELELLRKIAEKSSDLVKGFDWPDFCKACGGIEKLKEEHADAVNEHEEWLQTGESDYP